MYTLAKGISPTIMENVFRFPNNRRYNLRSQITFQTPFRDFVYNGTESISYLPPPRHSPAFPPKKTLYEYVTDNLKIVTSLTSLKEQTNKWIPKN